MSKEIRRQSLSGIARRSRGGQSVLFAVVICLLVGATSVSPLLTRSFSWALVRYHASLQGAVSGQVTLSGDASTPYRKLVAAVDPRVRAVTAPPSGADYTNVNWTLGTARLQYTTGECAHVKLVSGRCPTGRNEVMLSEAGYAHTSHLRLGEKLPITESNPSVSDHPHKTMTFVGVFTADPNDPVWGGIDVGQFAQGSLPDIPTQYWLTSRSTFEGPTRTEPAPKGRGRTNGPVTTVAGWTHLQHSAIFPIKSGGLTPARLQAAVAGLAATGRHIPSSVNISEPLSNVRADTRGDLDQVGQILPLLLVQLAAVLLILLAQLIAHLASVRRSEAALLKLRGHGVGGVIGFGFAEFTPSFVLGGAAGLALAYGVDWFARTIWLPGHVPTAWNWPALLIGVVTSLAVLGIWAIIWRRMADQPITSLLRARPERSRGIRVSSTLAAVAALCIAGVLLTATHTLTGAPVLITPILLAALVALVVFIAISPVAGAAVRRLLRAQRPAAALSTAQMGRRAGVGAALITLIISTTLLTLSLSIYARGDDNRAARAASDIGAVTSLSVVASSPGPTSQDFVDAVTKADPTHSHYTPVVTIQPVVSGETGTVGVIPADMERIGTKTGVRHAIPWTLLAKNAGSGTSAALIATSGSPARVGSDLTAPTMAFVDGPFRVVGSAPYIPGIDPSMLVTDLRTMLAAGNRTQNVTYQVLGDTTDSRLQSALTRALHRAGFDKVTVTTAAQRKRLYDASATAWATNVSLVVSVMAVIAAVTSILLVAVASRGERRDDLMALRTAEVPGHTLRRATVGEFGLIAFIGGTIGVLCAPAAAYLIGPTMPWWATKPPIPVTATGFQWVVGSIGGISLVMLLVVVAAGCGLATGRARSRLLRPSVRRSPSRPT